MHTIPTEKDLASSYQSIAVPPKIVAYWTQDGATYCGDQYGRVYVIEMGRWVAVCGAVNHDA